MICVSIGRGRHRMVVAEHRHLAERGAQLVELRLDYIIKSVNLRRLIHDRPCPVIITCRREKDGGKWQHGEEARLMLLRQAIAEEVDYVDLEHDIAAKIPRYGKTKRIVSYHDFRKTPDDLEGIHAGMCQMDADVVKIATLANQPSDNLRMLKLIGSSEVPTAGLCMGDIGTPSRILSGRFGAPFTYATFNEERALAPGQLSFDQMQKIYHYDQVNQDTVVYGVIADPVGHSLSPHVHNAAFRKAGINAVYVPFRVPAEALEDFVDRAPELGIRGLSVTIPHKEAIAGKLTAIDGAVKGIQAINTVIFDGAQIKGYNTDYKAAIDCLEGALGEIGADPSPLYQKKVMILGAGGAARAIAYGVKKKSADFVVASRSLDRSKALAEQFNGKAVEWGARHGVGCDVLVNCTPVGMHPDVDETPYEKHRLRPGVLVFDAVYSPENTLLIKDAREQGCNVITGVEMFVRQAAWQFYLFTGKPAPAKLMLEVVRRRIGAAKM